jgi:hypothetical protein
MKQLQGTFKADEFWLNKKDKLGWIRYPAFADIKHDGEYCVADTRVGGGVLINSYGKARTDCPILKQLPEDSVFYGELTWNGGFNGDLYSLLSHKMDDEMRMFVFDASILHGKDITAYPFIDRREMLLNAIPKTLGYVYVVSSTYCENESDAQQAFDVAVSQGYEGVVLKQANQRLLFGASCTWVKLKYTTTADLKIVSIDPNKERIECELPNRRPLGVKVMNKVKATLSVGDMVEIQHYGVLSGGGLRHPVYIRKREPNKRVSVDI